jgi:ferredoxin
MNAPGAGFPATVVISDSETVPIRNRPGGQDMRPDGPRHFDVEQIGHVGAELILAARAFGAGTVLVVRGPQTHPAIEKALDAQIRMADAILHGLGMQAGNDRFGAATARAPSPGGTAAATDSGTRPESPSSPPTSIPRCPDRNMQLRLLAQHLYERAGVKEPSISLPAGSPFGSVAVDSSRCSLCMACALACPSLALSAGGDVPRLMFQESRCHQCGLCEEVCPEGAIRRQSRMLCDRDAAEKKAVLAEAIPFRCIECGDPFASPALIDRIRTKLDGHRMYSDERQRRRLQMCRTCRTRDALSSQEMRSWIES